MMKPRPDTPGWMQTYLTAGENVLDWTKRHWIVLLGPVALWALVMTGAIVLGFYVSPDRSNSIADWVSGVVAVIATIFLALRVLRWITSRYVVTDSRVILIEGVISRNISSLRLEKMTDTVYRRPVMGRVFGYGDLLLDSAGEVTGLEVMDHLPRSNEIYRLISSLLSDPPIRGNIGSHDPATQDTGPLPRIRR